MRSSATFEIGAVPVGDGDGGQAEQLPNLRHLRAFLRVADLRSVNRAAASVHLSQPAVSQAIMRLEALFGVALLVRHQTGVTPTEPGQVVAARVARALEFLARGLGASRDGDPERRSMPPDLSPAQLNALGSIIRTGDAELAARSMGITAASLLRNLRMLEERLGVQLVLRDGARVLPTEAALELGRAVRLALRELELAREEIGWLRGLARGRIVIGAMPLTRTYIAPKTLVSLALRYPEVRTEIVEGPYSVLLQGLRDGSIDLLIGALRDPAPADDVVQEPMFDEELCVVAGAGHPLAGGRRPALPDLFDYPWVQPRAQSPARDQYDHLRRLAGRAPPITFEVASHMAVRAILLESEALALLSRQQILYEQRNGQLVVLPVSWPQFPRTIGVTTRKGWSPTVAQREFMSTLRDVCTGLQESEAAPPKRAGVI